MQRDDARSTDSADLTIALDAMGSDFAPGLAVVAAGRALRADPGLRIRVFGEGRALRDALAGVPRAERGRVECIDVDRFVAMETSPARALRRDQRSSMAVALEDVRDKRSNAIVSAGNTGALMALARSILGTISGIERPALMTAFPVATGRAWVLDLGANIGVDAERLFEFAQLGSAAVEALLGRSPRVGLLNIGREPSKGPDVIREAARWMEQADSIDYIGFVEGHDVFTGRADVVVCDGFAGNVLLKSAEGSVTMLLDQLRQAAARPVRGLALRGVVGRLAHQYDPSRHNGASLLGINGIVIKSHAHASADGLAQAIRLAALEVRHDLLPSLEQQLWSAV